MADGRVVLGDRYVISDLLGRGGMAEVHRGLDQRLGRPVAVKQLSATLAADPTCQARFRREAHAAASLNHPAIAAVFDTGEETDPQTGISIPYIVMELVDGSTLRSLLLDGPPLEVADALRITEAILEALSHSHHVGIIHRDIKPANVMLTQAGTVKVMDFGIARAIDDTTVTSLTQTATVIGTAQYLSPEQARGESVDVRSDIYSTGCVLYELLVGRTPFVGDSALSMAYQHVHEDPLPPSRVNSEVTPEMDAIVLRALAKNPDDRFPTAEAMATEIRRVLAGGTALAATQVVPAPLPGPSTVASSRSTTVLPPAAVVGFVGDTEPRRAVADLPLEPEEPERRRRGGWVIVAALVALLLLGSGLFWLFRPTPGNQVAVPDVVGSSRTEAKSAVEAAGFLAQFKNVRGDKATMGQVSRQQPAGGAAVAPGATITVELNVGPATAEIPDDLVGEDVEDALDSLKDAGFSNVTTRSAASDPADAKPGEVLEVVPEEGSDAAPDEDVVLTVAGVTATTEPAGPTSVPAPAPETTTATAKPKETKTTKAPQAEPEETETSDPDEEEEQEEEEEEPEASESAEKPKSSAPPTSASPEASASPATGGGAGKKNPKAEGAGKAPEAPAKAEE